MKILFDLQGCQSGGSRNRGIGRYSMAFAQAVMRAGPQHEFHVLLNRAFADTIDPIRAALHGLVPASRLHFFSVPPGCVDAASPPSWRTRAAETIRHCAIAQVRPDWVHVGSLFEGLVDDCAVDIAAGGPPTSVTVYDFIPYLNAERYLAASQTRAWYMRKLDSLRRASLMLGISASACAEAHQVLPDHAGKVVNASTAADPRTFHPAIAGDAAQRHGLHRPFVMYTGGIDWRKNIDALIGAFASLPPALRDRYQLAIVCHAGTYARTQLEEKIRKMGLRGDDVVLTGYVTDEDLADLYRSCELFVFPSLHEGFGLPALEAMMCGAPVIGSNTSSIPEVIGRDDAMFDPRSESAIAALMQRALQDDAFRDSLKSHALSQAARFSWDNTARTALAAIEEAHAARPRSAAPPHKARPRLAMVAPLPPSKSGIAQYTSELLPALAQYYDIELVHDQPEVRLPAELSRLPVRDLQWFRAHAHGFDRVVYQFGNSMFHAHMFGLLREFPGVVVLHDFFLSGAINWMDTLGVAPGAFRNALLRSHGREALAFEKGNGRDAAVARFPCSRFVVERASGVIVHSRFSRDAAREWYGDDDSNAWRVVPHLRVLREPASRGGARNELGIPQDRFLVCSFGHLGPSKMNTRLLAAWNASALGSDPSCKLVLVGENPRPPYGDEVMQLVRQARIPGQVEVTGYADRRVYERYLAAADVAVQLRTASRGETSGAVLDCLGSGLPVVVNANGPVAEYPRDILCLLPDEFSDAQLVQALECLRGDPAERARLSQVSRAHVAALHDPAHIAQQYRDAIEHFAASPRHVPYWAAVDALAALGGAGEAELADAAAALDATWQRGPCIAGDTTAPSASR